jgi:hypothetical protein
MTREQVWNWIAARGGWAGASADSKVALAARLHPETFKVIGSNVLGGIVAIYPIYPKVNC